jgi:hypothetical protein
MPSFFARIAPADATVVPWIDPATSTEPSRINPRAHRPLTLWHVAVGSTVHIEATVPTLGLAPVDALLGGRLFTGHVLEAPVPHGITPTAGQSSKHTIVPLEPGHYAVALRRPGSGAVIVHFEAVE